MTGEPSDVGVSRRRVLQLTAGATASTVGGLASASADVDDIRLSAWSGLAYNDGSGYVLTGGREIKKFDVQTREVTNSFSVSENTRPTGLAYGEGSLWFADGIGPDYDGKILELDPESGAVRSSISTSYDPRGMAFGKGSVWAVDITGNTVVEYTPGGSVQSRFGLPTTTPQGLAYFRGSIWVGDYCYSTSGCSAYLYEYSTDGTLRRKTNEKPIPGDENGGYGSLATTETQLLGPGSDGTLSVLRTLVDTTTTQSTTEPQTTAETTRSTTRADTTTTTTETTTETSGGEQSPGTSPEQNGPTTSQPTNGETATTASETASGTSGDEQSPEQPGLTAQSGQRQSATTVAGDSDGIPILTQFADSGTSIGMGLLGLVGGAGGYALYRRRIDRGQEQTGPPRDGRQQSQQPSQVGQETQNTGRQTPDGERRADGQSGSDRRGDQ